MVAPVVRLGFPWEHQISPKLIIAFIKIMHAHYTQRMLKDFHETVCLPCQRPRTLIPCLIHSLRNALWKFGRIHKPDSFTHYLIYEPLIQKLLSS